MAHVTLDVSTDGIADLRLARPQASNAIDLDLARDLAAAVARIAADDTVRVVRLSAEGPRFCVGGDIGWFAASENRDQALALLADTLHDGIGPLIDLRVPVVARVAGPAAGAGLSLVLAADIAIAGESASFTSAYTGIGLSPDGGQSWLLPRMVGRRVATEMILTNRRIKAPEAAQLGLITRAVPDDRLDAAVDEVVAALAAGPTVAYAAARRLLHDGTTAGFAEHLKAEAASISALAGGPTGTEGVDAFLNKRPPEYPAR